MTWMLSILGACYCADSASATSFCVLALALAVCSWYDPLGESWIMPDRPLKRCRYHSYRVCSLCLETSSFCNLKVEALRHLVVNSEHVVCLCNLRSPGQ